MLATDWSGIFTAVSASAAAIAAIAAWATVYVEHRARARAREPVLSITVAAIMNQGYRNRVTIENEGGGLARAVSFLVVDPDTLDACIGPLPPTGTLRSGDRVVLAPGYPGRRGALTMAAVVCRSGPYLLAWNVGGKHCRHRLRWKLGRTVSPAEMFRRLYSDAPEVGKLKVYRYEIEAVEAAGA
jgi:hypothetical protein